MSRSTESDRSGVRSIEIVQHGRKQKPARAEPVHALITGASGFIGMHLAERLLADGKRVRLFVRRPDAVARLRSLGAEVVTGTLDDVEAISQAVEGVETVYHLAAMTSALRVADMQHANGEGARNVAQACAAQDQPPVLLQVSSIAAAGPTERGKVRRETDEPAPISNYGRSKLSGEQAVAEFAGGVPITIMRPGIVFGPRNREMLAMFQTIKYANVHPVPGWRSPALSLVHVDDCVETLVRAAERGSRLPAEGANQLTSGRGVYFASSPEFPDYAELGRLLRKLLGRPWAPVLPLIGPLPWIAAAVNEGVICRLRGRPDSFNLDKIREAKAPSWACSGELAERELGVRPVASLEERFASTVEWYYKNRWL
jgi:nucleoside-diphosphate-sugar epimerase